jgi:hypothetical protein
MIAEIKSKQQFAVTNKSSCIPAQGRWPVERGLRCARTESRPCPALHMSDHSLMFELKTSRKL